MRGNIEQRLSKLEQRRAAKRAATLPGYVALPAEATESEIAAAVAAAGKPVKVYLGCSPDDWD